MIEGCADSGYVVCDYEDSMEIDHKDYVLAWNLCKDLALELQRWRVFEKEYAHSALTPEAALEFLHIHKTPKQINYEWTEGARP